MKKILFILLLVTKLVQGQTDLDYLLFNKINTHRNENGLPMLIWSNVIWEVANKHTKYQSLTGYMGHRENIDLENHNETTRLVTRFKNNNIYDYFNVPNRIIVGENCLVVVSYLTIEEKATIMLQMWISSPSHNNCLLDITYAYGAVSCEYGDEWKGNPGYWLYSTFNTLGIE